MNADAFAHQETVEDVFIFVNDVILPSMVDYEYFGNFIFRLNHDPSYDAAVMVLSGGRFRISINTGLVDQLIRFIESDLASDNGVLYAHIREGVELCSDTDQNLNLVLVSALVFVLLHEAYHAIGGHSEYWLKHGLHSAAATGTVNESSLTQRALPPNFSTLIELEADGSAYATTLEFSRHIFATVTGSGDLPNAQIPWIERSVILGSLSALAVLQEVAPVPESRNEEGLHHFPSIRVLNACSANYRAMAQPTYSTIDGDPYIPDELGSPYASSLAHRYANTILPAIVMLDSMLANHFSVKRFLIPSATDPSGIESAFMRDIRSLLCGRKPTQSASGQEFAKLIPRRVEFMEQLVPYRRANLW